MKKNYLLKTTVNIDQAKYIEHELMLFLGNGIKFETNTLQPTQNITEIVITIDNLEIFKNISKHLHRMLCYTNITFDDIVIYTEDNKDDIEFNELLKIIKTEAFCGFTIYEFAKQFGYFYISVKDDIDVNMYSTMLKLTDNEAK